MAIILGAGQLIKPQNGSRNLLSASLLFCLGLIHLITFSQKQQFFSGQPVLVGIQIPLFTLLGPLFYLYFMRILNPSFSVSRKQLVHFVPTLATLLVLIPYFSQSASEKMTVRLGLLSGKTGLWDTFPNNLVVLIFVSTLVYILLPLNIIRPLFKRKLLLGDPIILTSLGFILCFSLTLFCVIFYQFYDSSLLEESVAIFYTCWIVAIYLVSQKFPVFLTTVTDRISHAKYQRSQLVNINTHKILEKLEQRMEKRRLFLDEELTLPALAKNLSLTTHQLSEILNHNLNTNFKNYIKKYRINEAKRLLIDEPSQTILTIALDVGFRSTSTFNSSFKKETGSSPMEYRKFYADKH